jgi:integrase/recombinase XerC
MLEAAYELVKEKIQTYLLWKGSYCGAKTLLAYQRHLKNFSVFVAGKTWEEIRTEDLFKHLALEKTKYRSSYIAHKTVVLRDFFKFYIKETEVEIYKLKIPRYSVTSPEPVSEAEHQKLLALLNEDKFSQLMKKVILELFWHTGMRVSELCDLNISDLDTHKTYAQIVTKKNGQFRFVFWPKETHQLLLRYLGVRLTLNQENYLFFAPEDSRGRRMRLTTRSVQRWIEELCELANLRKISPHKYRHAKAHRMKKAGADALEIAKVLGHSDKNPSAVWAYLKLSPGEMLSLAEKFCHV